MHSYLHEWGTDVVTERCSHTLLLLHTNNQYLVYLIPYPLIIFKYSNECKYRSMVNMYYACFVLTGNKQNTEELILFYLDIIALIASSLHWLDNI